MHSVNSEEVLTPLPHAVCMPCPSQGHINSMLQLAKLLHHLYGFHITFVHSDFNYARILATSGPTALAGTPHFQFVSIPESDHDDGSNQESSPPSGHGVAGLAFNIRYNMRSPFKKLVKRLNGPSSGGPNVTCILGDSFANFSLSVAAELGIPAVSFCSMSACGFMGCFAYKQLIDDDIFPLNSESDLSNGYLDTPIDIPGMKNMRLKDLPSFIQTTNPHDVLFNFCKDEAQDALKATTIIINTFDELEGPTLDALSSILPPIYAVGPLNLLSHRILNDSLRTTIGSSMWKEDTNCLQWLDGRRPRSVIYVNFGSIAVMTKQQLMEFAWGLADSGYNFLWVIRPGIVKEESEGLPHEFLVETKKRGLLASWCSQEDVLRHPSVGVFLTHCGWNSTIESISAGVPMICWPFFADQQTNCRYLCTMWGNGVEIEGDVERVKVEKVIRMAMGGEKGDEMRRMATKWKEGADKALEPDGSSFQNLDSVIKELLLKSCNQNHDDDE